MRLPASQAVGEQGAPNQSGLKALRLPYRIAGVLLVGVQIEVHLPSIEQLGSSQGLGFGD